MRLRSVLLELCAIGLTAAPCVASDLSVRIDGIKSNRGTVRVALFNGADGFPGGSQAVAAGEVAASPGFVVIRFPDFAAGAYAISLYHDENGNRTLDTNLFGLPKEGYGFSNNAKGHFGPPDFSAASFRVGTADTSIGIDIRY